MLEAESLVKSFGKLIAVDHFSMNIERGEVKALIGPNGAGKTTFVNLVTGALTPDEGRIRLDSRCIVRLPSYKRARLGIARTYQIPKPYPNLTVLENVMVSSIYAAGLEGEDAMSAAVEALKYVGIYNMADKLASELNAEQQKLLDFARALAARPKYLLIDEIGAGLSVDELEGLASKIRAVAKQGVGVLYIGHIMKMVKSVADWVIVMNEGRKVTEGTYDDIANNEEVIKIYLGEKGAVE
ncbi:Branched-chain amino acid ABC transporter, ATPase component [Acidilobus saccharovorans 345-15]|uniref:Branched-chain amino acid ABC transporter, ATPase component n=1 Tax=Acidilobus saccharovorans (strain DSM 16705 / JCM 18335 / VKM B-2471 / 345-15) TaxID=666510 RepID=D9Q1M0_ACIS3|nr:ABC transporter ATP-binding protein [Acidilobus saccharovorans]ADL19208.1 Branched-chain amino acid ABC transporter, ATPase component [Acidilobus saccharovorans 345-15]